MSNKLPEFEITFDDGEKLQTSMAKHVTLEMATDYYVGKLFTKSDETQHRGVSVRKLDTAETWDEIVINSIDDSWAD